MPSLTDRLRSPLVLVTAVLAVVAVAVLIVSLSDDDPDDVTRLGETAQPLDPDAADADTSVLDRPYDRFDGTEATLSDDLGRPMVVNFFASWCAACVKEMPAFAEVHDELSDEVSFVGMAVSTSREDAEGLVESTGVGYAIGDDPDGAFVDAFGGLGMPTTVFLDADGTVLDVHTGELTADELRDRISEVLS